MRPKEVKKYEDILKLKRDNAHYGDASIIFNRANEVVISVQKVGEEPTGEVFLSRRQFQRFVDWWEQGE